MTGAVLFDLDGTLTDPKLGITRCIQYALSELGECAPASDNLEWCIGPPLQESFETLLGNRERAQRALEIYRRRFSEIGLYENRPYDGVAKALSDVRKSGARMFVATSKPTVYAARIVAHFGMADYFEAAHGSELDGTRSNKAELIGWIVQRHQLDTSTTVMIGDRSHDIFGARANRIASIGVLYGYGTRDELIGAGATVLCERPSMLLDAIGSPTRSTL